MMGKIVMWVKLCPPTSLQATAVSDILRGGGGEWGVPAEPMTK